MTTRQYEARDIAIFADNQPPLNLSVRELAKKYSLSSGRIHQILSRLRANRVVEPSGLARGLLQTEKRLLGIQSLVSIALSELSYLRRLVDGVQPVEE